jgi:hypothetical protein
MFINIWERSASIGEDGRMAVLVMLVCWSVVSIPVALVLSAFLRRGPGR